MIRTSEPERWKTFLASTGSASFQKITGNDALFVIFLGNDAGEDELTALQAGSRAGMQS
jgi:hypothetical protein